MPPKRPQFLQAPVQLSLFDVEPAPVKHPLPSAPPSAESQEKQPRKRQLLAGTHLIEYALRRSKRRSIGFLIEEDGLRVTAPRWVTVAEIEEAIRSKHRWILKKLTEQQRYWATRKNPTPLHDGAPVAYLGKTYTLRLQPALHASFVVTPDEAGQHLVITSGPSNREGRLQTGLEQWLKQEAHRVFSQRLSVFAEKLGVTYRAFALSSAKTQWGSCTASGNIRLNWRLIHLPLHVIDYVIAHELAHRREMNHSTRFWSAVQSVLPAYREAQTILKNHSPSLIQQL